MTKQQKIILGILGAIAGVVFCILGITLVIVRQQEAVPTSLPVAQQPIPVPSSTPTETSTPTKTPTPTLTATLTPFNTRVVADTATPTQIASFNNEVVISTPEINFDDLAPHRQAMLPNFVSDVDTVAATGASRYYISLISDSENFDGNSDLLFGGEERIRYTNTEDESLTEIYFRLYPNLYGGQLTIESAVVDGQLVTPVLSAANSVLKIPLSTALSPGTSVDISLFFNLVVPANAQQGYNIFSYSNQTASLSTFYPVIAVYDDKGWNTDMPVLHGDPTYLDVALYQVQLTVPESMVVTASGSQVNSMSNQDGTKTILLASGPVRDFYIAMREDYQVLSEIVDGTLVNSYYPPDLKDGGQQTLRYAVDALRIFNQHFGQYPYVEFDIAATPTTAGGVEYPGIVVIAENLYDLQGVFFQHATVHEVAHQWWYALVGNDQINEPWLDEALTNYSTIVYWQEIEGQKQADFIIDSFFVGPYEQEKKQGNDKAVVGSVSDFTPNEYGTFVYGKGSLFFYALQQNVGDQTYFKIMQTYYTNHKYKLATANSLLNTIEQVSDQDIEPLAETWLYTP